MTVSPAERQYILAQVNRLAADQLAQLWDRAAALADIDFAAFVKQAFPELVDPFAAMAADLAAAWYDETPSPTTYIATPALLPDPEKLAASVDWALGANGRDAVGRMQGTAQRAIMDAARETIVSNAAAETGSKWVRYASANACAFCALMATRENVYASEHSALHVVGRGKNVSQNFNADGTRKSGGQAGGVKLRGAQQFGEKYHDNCVPAGTLVSGPRTEAAYRRLYEGEAVVIHTASGQNLTITPNHPVLTDQGWVPAGLLNEGDNVIRSLGSDSGAATVPHEHQRPTPIEDVWGSLAVNGLAGVPGSAEDFHGDGTDREVDIVWADRHLSQQQLITRREQLVEGFLSATLGRGPRPRLSVGSQPTAFFPSAGSSSGGFVGGTREGLSLVGACARHADLVGIGRGSGGNAHLNQATADHNAIYAESVGAFHLGQLLIDIEGSQVHCVDTEASGARFDPAGFEFTGQGRGVYARLGLDLLSSLAGHVELDRVVECRRISFSDHVYNLQTENGWYSADSLIVSNCHCVAVEVRPGASYEPPAYVQDWKRSYQDAFDAVPDGTPYDAKNSVLKAVLSNMRSDLGSH